MSGELTVDNICKYACVMTIKELNRVKDAVDMELRKRQRKGGKIN